MKIFGIEHILYLIIVLVISIPVLFVLNKYKNNEKVKNNVLKVVGGLLFIAIMVNRLSIVFKNDNIKWSALIPDSYCGMSSLVLSLAVLLGKKDNAVLHFVWFLALLGGIITHVYPDFLPQNPSIFYIPTISGLLHHTFAVFLVVLILMYKHINITYKKWYCTLFGFTCYFSVGAFLISVFDYNDAFHMMEPILGGTPLTSWVMAPIYIVLYGLVILFTEICRRKKE